MMKETGHLPKKIHMTIKFTTVPEKLGSMQRMSHQQFSLQYNLRDNNHCVCNFQ